MNCIFVALLLALATILHAALIPETDIKHIHAVPKDKKTTTAEVKVVTFSSDRPATILSLNKSIVGKSKGGEMREFGKSVGRYSGVDEGAEVDGGLENEEEDGDVDFEEGEEDDNVGYEEEEDDMDYERGDEQGDEEQDGIEDVTH